MTVLADFNVIIGDIPQPIVLTANDQTPVVGEPFNTGGRMTSSGEIGPSAAFLLFSVANLHVTLDVFVNEQGPVGLIMANPAIGWYTQTVTMAGSRLRDGNNQISVGLVGGWQGVSHFFQDRNLICFYH